MLSVCLRKTNDALLSLISMLPLAFLLSLSWLPGKHTLLSSFLCLSNCLSLSLSLSPFHLSTWITVRVYSSCVGILLFSKWTPDSVMDRIGNCFERTFPSRISFLLENNLVWGAMLLLFGEVRGDLVCQSPSSRIFILHSKAVHGKDCQSEVSMRVRTRVWIIPFDSKRWTILSNALSNYLVCQTS